MGKVYRVYHTGWKVDLAMKQPHARLFETEAQKENFIHECDAWINLGLHPHIVSCFYVREIDGVPSIFSEWMDGGNLTDWIADGKVDTLEKMLDIAIQFAWGLGYAHEQGLIHQDVKPDNVLLTSEGDVKIADFGIANAKRNLTMTTSRPVDFTGTMVGEAGAYTPVYAAPEQLAGEQLTRRTDIFSWAISLVEIGIGGRQWQGTSAAVRTDFDFYMGNTVFPIPSSLKELLRGCLKDNESERPHDFKIIADKLLGIYRETIGKDYPRPMPKSAVDSPDTLNNRALSYLDMDKPEEAKKAWRKALEADPQHLDSIVNQGVFLCRAGKMEWATLLMTLEGIPKNAENSAESISALEEVYMEYNDFEKTGTVVSTTFTSTVEQEIDTVAETLAKYQRDSISECRIFEGHTTTVNAIAFSPDGRFVLSGSGSCCIYGRSRNYNTLRLWDVATGACLCIFEGHMDKVNSVAFSRDGLYIVSGSSDRTLKLWSVKTGEGFRIFERHAGEVNTVTFSPADERVILSGSSDNTIRLWDIATGMCLRVFKGHDEPVRCVAFSPDGHHVISCAGSVLQLWDVATGECMQTFKGHTHVVNSVAFSPDGHYVVSGSHDMTLRLWNIASGKYLRTFKGHAHVVNSVAFSPDGRFVLSGSSDKTLRLWDNMLSREDILRSWNYSTGRCLRIFEGHTNDVNAVAFNPDGCSVLSGSNDNTLRLWNFRIPKRPPWRLSIVRGWHDVITGQSEYNRFRAMAEHALEAKNFAEAIRCVKEARNVPGYERNSEILDLKRRIIPHCVKTILRNAWSLCPFEKCTFFVNSAVFSPDGQLAFSGGLDKTLKLWDVATGAYLRVFEGHTNTVHATAFSPNGHFALSGSDDKTLRLWEIATGECLRVFEGHTHFVKSIAFSPNGQQALSGSADCTLRLWNVSTGKCLHTFNGHTNWVNATAFSPDGWFILSGSVDCSLRLWNIATGECVRTFVGHADSVNFAVFSPDGQFVLSGSEDNTLRLWRLDWDLEVRKPHDWDDGAKPYLHNFLIVQNGRWNDEDFTRLIKDLQNRGYGWLHPEGVRKKLEKMDSKL